MVNETRRSILGTIRKNASWISGESLSHTYDISRVAVWKHIKALQAEGYNIESGHRGYKLTIEGDNLSSLDFDSSRGFRFYRELESTMNASAQMMGNPEKESEDFIILADHQLAGIGRDGKTWDSPSGGIYMTCVINRLLPVFEAPLMPFRGILTVLQSLELSGVKKPHFSWPGNIMIQGRKVGGVLDEYHVREGQIYWYALGIGIHINDTLSGQDVTSVSDITGLNLNRRKIVRLFKVIWEKNLSLPPLELCRDLSAYAGFLHKHVRVQTRLDGIIEGIARSIDTDGRLYLVSGRHTTSVSAGESVMLTITGLVANKFAARQCNLGEKEYE